MTTRFTDIIPVPSHIAYRPSWASSIAVPDPDVVKGLLFRIGWLYKRFNPIDDVATASKAFQHLIWFCFVFEDQAQVSPAGAFNPGANSNYRFLGWDSNA
jgi:hypothetical protein